MSLVNFSTEQACKSSLFRSIIKKFTFHADVSSAQTRFRFAASRFRGVSPMQKVIRSVTVHSVTSNTLRDAQKSCIRMISRRASRVFCELCSPKTPRGILPVNSNKKTPVCKVSHAGWRQNFLYVIYASKVFPIK